MCFFFFFWGRSGLFLGLGLSPPLNPSWNFQYLLVRINEVRTARIDCVHKLVFHFNRKSMFILIHNSMLSKNISNFIFYSDLFGCYDWEISVFKISRDVAKCTNTCYYFGRFHDFRVFYDNSLLFEIAHEILYYYTFIYILFTTGIGFYLHFI